MGLLDKKDIYLTGSGVRSFLDLTLYAQKVLKECEVVFTLIDIHSLQDYLKEITKRTVDLIPKYYREGRHRFEIYKDVANHIIEAARKERPVVLLLHGHPLVYSTVSQLILKMAKEENFSVEVIPGISALDRIFVDLNLDISQKGIQIFEASAALHYQIDLNPRVDCILFQIGAPLGPIHEARPTRADDIYPLRDYLLKFFPPSHEVTVVESSVELGIETKLTKGPLGDLTKLAPAFNYTASLYIPGI